MSAQEVSAAVRAIQEALDVLGVAPDSDPAAVAHAYRRLARATHPDVSTDPQAAQRFATLAAAYQLLRTHARAPAPLATTASSGASPGERSYRRTEPATPDRDLLRLAQPAYVVDLSFDDPAARRTPRQWSDSPGSPIVAGPVTVTPHAPAPGPSGSDTEVD